jgi:hypothetical protein
MRLHGGVSFIRGDEMTLIDPPKQAERKARRKARREKIRALIAHLIRELDELTDDIEDAVTETFGPGAPINPDMDKFGK